VAGEPRTLLDVNVLIALLDDAHVFSRRANEWLESSPRLIATCPIVENGVVRIMSAPAYSSTHRASPEQVANGLKSLARTLDHEFWPDAVSLLDDAVIDFSRLHGHRQIMDAYLLALAVQRRGACVVRHRRTPCFGPGRRTKAPAGPVSPAGRAHREHGPPSRRSSRQMGMRPQPMPDHTPAPHTVVLRPTGAPPCNSREESSRPANAAPRSSRR